MLVHLDLFSGIGGFALACQWNEIETIGFVEIDKYCQKVLRKHWADVPIVEDIRDVEKIKEIITNATSGRFQECELCRQQANDISEVCQTEELVENPRCQYDEGQLLQREYAKKVCKGTTDSSKRPNSTPRNCVSEQRAESKSPAILVTAGFPCQPFSVAGKRGSKEDDRYLWPQTLAVIEAIKPRWILLENVTGIINLALDTVLSDLEGTGYSYETLVIPACAVNAPHRRDRIWVVGHATGNGQFDTEARRGIEPRNQRSGKGTKQVCQSEGTGSLRSQDVTNSRSPESGGLSGKQRQENTEIRLSDWWAVEPELGRVAHGIPNRVDRLKCLGNAIVPQVAYEIIKVIKEVDEQDTERHS